MRSLLELWHQQNQYNQQKADLKGEQKKQGEAREQARQQAMLQRIVSLSSSYKYFYLYARIPKAWKGTVFTGVCSHFGEGGTYLSADWGGGQPG